MDIPFLHPNIPCLVLSEQGEWEDGNGVQIVLLPHHLLVSFRFEGEEEQLLVPLIDILEGMTAMAKDVES